MIIDDHELMERDPLRWMAMSRIEATMANLPEGLPKGGFDLIWKIFEQVMELTGFELEGDLVKGVVLGLYLGGELAAMNQMVFGDATQLLAQLPLDNPSLMIEVTTLTLSQSVARDIALALERVMRIVDEEGKSCPPANTSE